MRQLAAGDAFMLYTESPSTPNHIGALGILDPSTAPSGTLSFEELIDYFGGRIHLTKAFRQRVVRVPLDLDRPWWVQDGSFDLEYHLRHTALPSPGNWTQLCRLVARLHARPLDLSRPPWEAYLIEGINDVPGVPPGAVAVLVRFHHCAVDGVGGMEVLSALFQLSPDEGQPDEPDTWTPEPVPGPWDLLARAAVGNAVRPLRIVRRVTSGLPGAARLPSRLRRREVRLPTLSVPTTRFNSRVSPHRAFGSYEAPLDDLKRVRTAVEGATINDVILTVCAGGLRRYLSDLGELPEASLAAAVPVSLRSGPAGQEGNAVAQLFCDLHTDIADPLERLAAVAETTRVAKGSQPALGATSLMEISGNLPGALFGLALRANAEFGERTGTAGLLNTQISNVPGPSVPLYCAGAQLLRLYGLGPVITGAALIHVVMSYCGRVTFSFISDRDLMPEPEHYVASLAASLAELLGAAESGGRPGAGSVGPIAGELAWDRLRRPVVHAWLAAVRPGQPPPERAWATLTDDERAEAARYRHPDDRLRFVTARALLRTRLAERLDLPAASVPLRRQPSRRLALDAPAARADLHFSVTHGGAWVAVALAAVPVGVDVEPVASDDPDPALLRRVCTDRERAGLAAGPAAFARLWTRKEAVVKGSGETSLARIDVSRTRVAGAPHLAGWRARNLNGCGAGHAVAVAAVGHWVARLHAAPAGLLVAERSESRRGRTGDLER